MTNDLPEGYRWATESEMNRDDAIVVPLTVDSTGTPYTHGEADVAVPIGNKFIYTHFPAPEKDRDRHFTLCHKSTGPIAGVGEYPTCLICQKRARPNSNPILQLMRDGDLSDPWGTAMGWAFACAENLAAVGADVPNELGYQMSVAGPVIESWEDFAVAGYLGILTEEIEGEFSLVPLDETTTLDKSRIAEVQRAAKILDRYLGWCVAAGRDY